MEIVIRTYEDEDFELVASLLLDSWKSTGVAGAQTETRDYLRDQLSEMIAQGASVNVAILGEEIIGVLTFQDDKLRQIFVAPAAQGKGIGKRLLDFAKAKNPDGFWLTTPVENERAIQFYEREGMKRGEISRHKRLPIEVIRFDWPKNSN